MTVEHPMNAPEGSVINVPLSEDDSLGTVEDIEADETEEDDQDADDEDEQEGRR